MTRRLAFLLAVVIAGLMTYGISGVMAGPNDSADGPKAVPGTGAGMPPTAQTLFGVVNATGTLARGFGATGSTRLAVGQYEVRWRQNVAGCSYQATIGQPGTGASPPGEITTALRAGNSLATFVTTHTSSGAFADRNFHIAVHC